jgi:hypothetical protein
VIARNVVLCVAVGLALKALVEAAKRTASIAPRIDRGTV